MTAGRGLVLALALGAALAGCGGGGEAGGGADADAAAARKARSAALKKELEGKIAIVSNALVKSPLDYERTAGDCDRYAGEAQDAGLKDLVERCQRLKKDARDTFETAAAKEIVEACAQARKYAVEGDVKKGRYRLDGLHKALLKDPRFADQALAARKDIDRIERSATYYERVTKAKSEQFKGREEWERAQGVLEAFLLIPVGEVSPKKKDVEAALAELKPKAEAAKAERARARAAAAGAEGAAKWVPAFNGAQDDIIQWELGDPNEANVVDKVLILRNAGEEQRVQFTYGQSEWVDYIVDMTLKVEKGTVYVYFRGEADAENNRSWVNSIKLGPEDFKGGFARVKFDCRGTEMRWTRPGSQVSPSLALKTKSGPFSIVVMKGAQVSIQKVLVKVTKQSAAEPEK